MSSIFKVLLIAVMTIGLACQSAQANLIDDETSVGSDGAARITIAGAKKLFDSGSAVFVDTRGESQFNAERIKGAINIPAETAATRWKEIPTDKKIIAYCS